MDLVDVPLEVDARRSTRAGTPVVLGAVGLVLGAWPALFLVGWVLGIAAIVVGIRALPEARQLGKQTAETIGVVLGVLAVLIGCGSLLRLVGFGDDEQPVVQTRADFVGGLVREQHVTRELAECMADGFEHNGVQLDDQQVGSASKTQVVAILRATLTCQGLGSDVSDCYLNAVVDIVPKDGLRTAAAFARAGKELRFEDHLRLVEAGFVCQGAPPAVARCTTNTMVDEFGRDIFDSGRLDLTPEQRKALPKIQAGCLAVNS